MRPAMVRKALSAGRCLAPATFGRTVSATLAETLMRFLATAVWLLLSAANLRYRNLRSRIHPNEADLQQVQQKRQFLGGVPGEIVVLGVPDCQLRILVPQIGGIDGVDGGRHRA